MNCADYMNDRKSDQFWRNYSLRMMDRLASNEASSFAMAASSERLEFDCKNRVVDVKKNANRIFSSLRSISRPLSSAKHSQYCDVSPNWRNELSILDSKCCNIIGSSNVAFWSDLRLDNKSASYSSSSSSNCENQQSESFQESNVSFFQGARAHSGVKSVPCCYNQFCLANRGLFCPCAKHMSFDTAFGENQQLVAFGKALENNSLFRDMTYSSNFNGNCAKHQSESNATQSATFEESQSTASNRAAARRSSSFSWSSNEHLAQQQQQKQQNNSFSFGDNANFSLLESINWTKSGKLTNYRDESDANVKFVTSEARERFFPKNFCFSPEEDLQIRAIKLEALKKRRERTRELQKNKKKARSQSLGGCWGEERGVTRKEPIVRSEFLSASFVKADHSMEDKENSDPKLSNGDEETKEEEKMPKKNNLVERREIAYNESEFDKECAKAKMELSPSDNEHFRRYSTRFSKEQTNFMRAWYDVNRHNPYASEKTIEKLAEESNLPARSVRKWLSNRRTRLLETRTYRKMKRNRT